MSLEISYELFARQDLFSLRNKKKKIKKKKKMEILECSQLQMLLGTVRLKVVRRKALCQSFQSWWVQISGTETLQNK